MGQILELTQIINQYLTNIVLHNQHLTYIILFLIFFAQTGFIPTAFLPGDSLLLSLGTFAASAANILNIHFLFVILFFGTLLGKNFNYLLGKWLTIHLSTKQRQWMFNLKYVQKAQRLYERWGGNILIIGCFIPVVRTFAPFVAGICLMKIGPFITYNIVGSVVWVGSLLYVGFLFGNIPIVREYFSLAILGFILLSLLAPMIVKFVVKLGRFNI